MFKYIIISATFFLISTGVLAQDPFFSQFYNSPVYLNPALTGCGQNNGRLAVTARMQWQRLTNPMKYITASVDKSFYHSSGAALLSAGLMVDYFSEGYLQNTTFMLPLAKSFGGNVNGECNDWFFSLGLQPGITIGSVDRDKFLFADQIDASGPTSNSSGVEVFKNNGRAFFTMAAGGIVCWKKFMLGVAVHNLNEPANGIVGNPDESKLPRRITGHLSYIWPTAYPEVKTTVIYQQQGASSMFTAGALIDWPESRFGLSVWYRDNVFKANNSIVIGATLKLGRRERLGNGNTENVSRLGITYDTEFTAPSLKTTYGSTELGFLSDFNTSRDIECPRTSGICDIKFPWEFF